MKRLLILILIIFSVISCNSPHYNKSLQSIFKKSGRNESELKEVLKKYSQYSKDSLKLRAAIFLIENMDGHSSYQSKSWSSFCKYMQTKIIKHKVVDKTTPNYDSIFSEYKSKLVDYNVVPDYQTITSEYLINNIDSAFLAWKQPFACHLNFNEFCEYLLPYKFGNEKIEPWRTFFSKQYIPITTNLDSQNIYLMTSNEVCDKLKSSINVISENYPYPIPDFPSSILAKIDRGPCEELARLTTYAGRSIGLPIVIDYTPHWANRSGKHTWNALINKSGKPLSFGVKDTVKLGHHLEGKRWERVSKIYRLTYAKQLQSLACVCGTEEIPDVFTSPFIKDVSKDYFNGIDLKMNLSFSPKIQRKFAYLSTFDNKKWVPVSWSHIKNKNVYFKGMNIKVVYLPTYLINGLMVPADYPILVLDSVKTILLKPNFTMVQSLILKRKFNNGKVEFFGERMKGGKFQLANKSDFSDSVDIYTIKNVPEICFNKVELRIKKKYKYFRYRAPAGSNGEVAEIEVYDTNSDKKLDGKIIAYLKVQPNIVKFSKVFDGDALTYYQNTKEKSIWIGLEFDAPKQINKIVYLPHNDENFICDGELYELFYWDSKWVSLGQQTGSIKTQSLTYNNVPTNALFLLRNMTKGSEERIFTYEKGKQVWW